MGATLNNSMIPERVSRTMDREAKVMDTCCKRRTITAGTKKPVTLSRAPNNPETFSENGLTIRPELKERNLASFSSRSVRSFLRSATCVAVLTSLGGILSECLSLRDGNFQIGLQGSRVSLFLIDHGLKTWRLISSTYILATD